ncbi:MAG TPA: bifunctional nuclease family protein [Armatimonadota bacterium]|nr:bifunctional nuclease family protein [Armatimonadota bacterium]
MASTDIELQVEAVALDWRGNPIVVLREKGGHRAVFIWVGLSEATAISMHLEKQHPPRPLTHDLIVSILQEVEVEVERVRVSDMRGITYYATLDLRDGDDTTSIDCRPSDAIAVALRARAPIYIDEELLNRLDEQRKDTGVELSPGAMIVEPGEPMVH